MLLDPSIDINAYVESLPPDEVEALLDAMYAVEEAERFTKFASLYPETGPFNRHLYRRHMEFFADGAKYRERCFMAANRVGKTYGGGGYETTCHLTGLYPEWWPGRRFAKPVRAVAAGKTNETTRDIVQTVLLGDIAFEGQRKMIDGSGLIPRELIDRSNGGVTWKQGVADLVDTIRIKHVTGGWSRLALKSYQQGRGSYEGTALDVIWDDEEPPMDVYGEQLIRTATTNGIIMLTFTPLEGMSEVVLQFLPASMRQVPSKGGTMKRSFIVGALLAATVLPMSAAAQSVVKPSDETFGPPASGQVTTANGRAAKAPVYIPVRPDGTVIDPAGSASGGVAQGSPTAGQTGPIVQCAVTTAPPTYATGTTNPFSCDPAGNQRVRDLATAASVASIDGKQANLSAIAPSANTALASSWSRPAARTLLGINVTSTTVSGYIMLFDSATVPADGAVTPLRCMPLTGQTPTGIEYGWRQAPLLFSSGVVVVFSSTGCYTKTASATVFISGDAR